MMQNKGDWQGHWIIDEDGECVAKTCPMCQKERPCAEFSMMSKGKYKLAPRCKACNSDYLRAWRKETTDSGETRAQRASRKSVTKYKSRSPEKVIEDMYRLHPEGTKDCGECSITKDLLDFNACVSNADGLQRLCRMCTTEECRTWYSLDAPDGAGSNGSYYRRQINKKNAMRSDGEVEADRDRLHPNGTKVCGVCRESLPLSEFYDNISSDDGLHSRCKKCDNYRYSARFIESWEDRGIPLECYVCRRPWEAGFHADHVVPVRLGGGDDISNRLPACPLHNASKNRYPLEVWLLERHPDIMYEVLDRVAEYGVDYSVREGDYAGFVVSRNLDGLLTARYV